MIFIINFNNYSVDKYKQTIYDFLNGRADEEISHSDNLFSFIKNVPEELSKDKSFALDICSNFGARVFVDKDLLRDSDVEIALLNFYASSLDKESVYIKDFEEVNKILEDIRDYNKNILDESLLNKISHASTRFFSKEEAVKTQELLKDIGKQFDISYKDSSKILEEEEQRKSIYHKIRNDLIFDDIRKIINADHTDKSIDFFKEPFDDIFKIVDSFRKEHNGMAYISEQNIQLLEDISSYDCCDNSNKLKIDHIIEENLFEKKFLYDEKERQKEKDKDKDNHTSIDLVD